MKRILLSTIALSSLVAFSCKSTNESETKESYTVVKENGEQKTITTDHDEVIVQQSELPQIAKSFIKDNFSSESIQNLIKENNSTGDEYKIQLSNGVKIDFDTNGEWKEIKAGIANQSVGTSFLPQVTSDYLNKNYPQIGVESIDKSTTGIDIELLNKVELKFDKKGNFLRIDN